MKKGRASAQNEGGVWSQKCIQEVCEENNRSFLLLKAQVLNERSRKYRGTRSRQAILLALCFA